MSRYRGPKLRITRRLGALPGLTQKQSKKNKGDQVNTGKTMKTVIVRKQPNMDYDWKKNKS